MTSLKSICIIWPPSPRDPTANHDWPRLKVLTLLALHSSHSSDIIINVPYSPHDSNPNPERGVFGGLQTLLSLDISNEDGPHPTKKTSDLGKVRFWWCTYLILLAPIKHLMSFRKRGSFFWTKCSWTNWNIFRNRGICWRKPLQCWCYVALHWSAQVTTTLTTNGGDNNIDKHRNIVPTYDYAD